MKKIEWYLFLFWKHTPGVDLEEFRSRRAVENRLREIIDKLQSYRIIQGKEYEAKVLEVEIEERKY